MSLIVLCLSSSAAFARLRDGALATGVLSGVLAFLPADERLKAGRVNKQWRQEVQSPSTWPNAGWYLTCHVDEANALPLPRWLHERVSVVRFSADWLLYDAPFTLASVAQDATVAAL